MSDDRLRETARLLNVHTPTVYREALVCDDRELSCDWRIEIDEDGTSRRNAEDAAFYAHAAHVAQVLAAAGLLAHEGTTLRERADQTEAGEQS